MMGLVKYYHRSPDQLTKEEIRAYLVHLTEERGLSPNSCDGRLLRVTVFLQ